LRFGGILVGVRLPFIKKRPKIDPLMSQPYSPTGKRFTRPIIAKVLQDEPKKPPPIDPHREELRRIVVAVGLWLAFALAVFHWLHDSPAARKMLGL
jgi:hypothetical protein